MLFRSPDVDGTARRTRKQFEALKKKGWKEVKGADANAPVPDPTKGND